MNIVISSFILAVPFFMIAMELTILFEEKKNRKPAETKKRRVRAKRTLTDWNRVMEDTALPAKAKRK